MGTQHYRFEGPAVNSHACEGEERELQLLLRPEGPAPVCCWSGSHKCRIIFRRRSAGPSDLQGIKTWVSALTDAAINCQPFGPLCSMSQSLVLRSSHW